MSVQEGSACKQLRESRRKKIADKEPWQLRLLSLVEIIERGFANAGNYRGELGVTTDSAFFLHEVIMNRFHNVCPSLLINHAAAFL